MSTQESQWYIVKQSVEWLGHKEDGRNWKGADLGKV